MCEKCKALVERSEGCDHMTCRICGAEWCWSCGAAYQQVGVHPKNKCYLVRRRRSWCCCCSGGSVNAEHIKMTFKIFLWGLLLFPLLPLAIVGGLFYYPVVLSLIHI
eukprot:TRINITY_DN21709_c0_g1_i1.p1 TRINITY_DN21709_c0_g1~~TRINITY_DN21709_c0_g1_i1.p1  ORF type:complete len:116 (-),score=4.70 TRINITY_DN21709_c0_g1_i1:36-356(-)